MIAKTLPEIPETPGLPQSMARNVPAFLAPKGSALEPLVAEFARLVQQYGDRARAHREIANPGALNTELQADDLAHARAVRNGEDDPGPVHVTAWKEAEETARRAVAGSRDALKLVWSDLLAQFAEPDVGGQIVAEIETRRDDARARLLDALEHLGTAMSDLDVTDDQATYTRRVHEYAVAWTAKPGAPQRPDGQTSRWPTGSTTGNPQPIVLNAKPEPRENVFAQLASYRAPRQD
jgi:hypothetical protein